MIQKLTRTVTPAEMTAFKNRP